MKSLPIRVRLSLWYFAMFALAVFALSLASWWMLRRSVDATEYHDLQERAEDVQILLEHQGPNRSLQDLQRVFASVYVLKDDGKWLQVRDREGNWIFRSKRMVEENPGLPPPDRLPANGIIAQFKQGTRYVRILSCPITAGGRRYSVQTGVALNKSMALLATFHTDLLFLTPAVILLAALGGYLMSRKALEPVAALTAEARRIHDRNLDTRLPVSTANDEISDLAKTLNQMLERIDKAFASVRAFTGNASHELRTPIALLRTEIEVALFRPRDPGEYRETLTRLHEETMRMTNLVETLLSLARADGGAETLTLQSIGVASLFELLESTWKPVMQRALLDFKVASGSEPLAILGDPTSVTRLLSILLENASKFTAPGGSVVLSAKAAANRIDLSVRDTGIGIGPEHLPKIFDRFYRAAPPRDATARGSGLGLALAKGIAERHGTRLTIDSEPGRGSCFSFSLERSATDAALPRIFSGEAAV
ncbi:MAG: ATP-binding protein [Acidobacteriaceae bacterium]